MKIGVAMSGGIDSTVTAAILKDKGHEVHGYFMLLPLVQGERLRQRVRLVAEYLGVRLHEVDLRQEFTDQVIRYFIDTYLSGRTPNPCGFCNPVIKFGLLRERVLSDGCDCMATGHYAKIDRTRAGQPILRRGKDPRKDQSYFLGRLSGKHLKYVILPLGGFTKDEVRSLAAEKGLPNVTASESQDVCFLEGKPVADFFQYVDIMQKDGNIVTRNNHIIGRHKGIFHYTIGQRRGLGIPDKTPWYVYRLDARQNRVVVAKKQALYRSRMHLCDMRFLGDKPDLPWQGMIQIRSRHKATRGILSRGAEGMYLVEFNAPQLSVTPGQFGILYDRDRVIGGGEIV